MHRNLFFAALIVLAMPATAQTGDEWNAFPSAPPPAPTPTPAPTVTVAPQSVDAGIAMQALRVEPAPEPKSTDEFRIISQKERILPGTEPHSPSTYGLAWDAKANARVTVGQAGISTAFVPSARLGPKGVVRVSLLGEYLNQRDFPVLTAQDIRSAVTFAASMQPFEWGEIFVAYGAAANSNNRTSPNLIQALGDLTLGIKASREWASGFHAGADLRLLTFSGVGNQGIDRFAVGFRPTLLATYDFRTVSPYAAFLVTAGLGFTLDSTAGLVSTQALNASEEFALGINRYHRFNFQAAIEVPLPWVSPFVEYSLSAPLGVAKGQLTGPNGKFISAAAAMPQTLGLGLKVTVIKDLTLLTGVNLGLTPAVGLGVAATPPWNFFLGAGFAIDPFQRGETKVVETIRERSIEVAKAHLEGVVTDAATGKPLGHVVVWLPASKPAATDERGTYETLTVSPGPHKVTFTKEGYTAAEREVQVGKERPTTLSIALAPEPQKARFDLIATADKKPVKTTISFKGPDEISVQTEDNGAPTAVNVAAGTYTITATAEGYLAQTRQTQIPARGNMTVAFELVPAPKKALVVFKGTKIEILQQVRFDTNKATIMPISHALLQQVVDSIVKNNVRRVRVEGHTDNRGAPSTNQALSDARANAVRDYLVSQGIDGERLEAVGYGDSRPIAPNLTARGRELNRRVEFIVLDK